MTTSADHYKSRHRAVPHYNPFISSHDAWIIENVPETGRAKCPDCHRLFDKYWHEDKIEKTYCAPDYFKRLR